MRAPIQQTTGPHRIVIVSGLSGSGKSTALKTLEDAGYFCIDNLPIVLLPDLLGRLAALQDGEARHVALVMDIREHAFLDRYEAIAAQITKSGAALELLFLEAEEEILVRRFSQTRRPHPLAQNGSARDGIVREREQLAHLRRLASRIIDTSALSVHQLRDTVAQLYANRKNAAELRIGIISFGFKHGLPAEADLVFDVRFLPNPYFIPECRERTGLDGQVSSFVLGQPETTTFLQLTADLLHFLLPQYRREKKAYLTIAVGCTGGRHRSVAIAGALREILEQRGELPWVSHRDLGKVDAS
ncbi:MAG: RNase adapter RapZ [Desulfobacteraceae bacterium]|nr:MAG: RNase adapter RapZ [Desulfobacteraceae bacterium]